MMDVCARNKVNCQVKEREKDWTHPFSFNYTINESTSETSTIEKKVKTTIAEGGGRGLGKKKDDFDLQDLFRLFMTLGFPIPFTMVIICFRSLNFFRKSRNQERKLYFIGSSSSNQLMWKLSFMRRILNLITNQPSYFRKIVPTNNKFFWPGYTLEPDEIHLRTNPWWFLIKRGNEWEKEWRGQRVFK